MKPLWLIIILIFVFGGTVNSQSNKAYCAQEITWFGLDYSDAYFIDSKAFPDPYRLRSTLIGRWNELVFREKKKFDIAKSFNKRHVNFDVSYINNRNRNADISKQISDDRFHQRQFNSDSIQNIVNSYLLNEDIDGVGLVFIVESLNKLDHEAVYWVTFFDVVSKKVLLTEQIIGKPSGGGLHNYWANSFYNALNKAERQMGFVF